MRHLKASLKFCRTGSHREAMFANMSNSLFTHELIKTTLAKAKELRRIAEPMITRAKTESLHNRRLLIAKLQDKAVVEKLATYALRRAMTVDDREAIENIISSCSDKDYRMRDLFESFVTSPLFLKR